MVYIWVPMATWSVVNLVRVLIDWRACIMYEKVRAASVTFILQSIPAGARVHDRRRDGTVLRIEVPPGSTDKALTETGARASERPKC
jgi:hypothetical protein